MHMYRCTVTAFLLIAGAFIFSFAGTAFPAEQDASVSATLKKPFTIALESNRTTGYSWSARFDKRRLKLKSSSYERPTETRPGAGGKQLFVFVPLKEGKTEVLLQYRRPWEKAPVEKKSYEIVVSP
jgi:predicted secreted protein